MTSGFLDAVTEERQNIALRCLVIEETIRALEIERAVHLQRRMALVKISTVYDRTMNYFDGSLELQRQIYAASLRGNRIGTAQGRSGASMPLR